MINQQYEFIFFVFFFSTQVSFQNPIYTHINKLNEIYIKYVFFSLLFCYPNKHQLMISVYVRMFEHGISSSFFFSLCFVHLFFFFPLLNLSIYVNVRVILTIVCLFVFFFCRFRMIDKEICEFRFILCVYVQIEKYIKETHQSMFYCVLLSSLFLCLFLSHFAYTH